MNKFEQIRNIATSASIEQEKAAEAIKKAQHKAVYEFQYISPSEKKRMSYVLKNVKKFNDAILILIDRGYSEAEAKFIISTNEHLLKKLGGAA